MFRMDIWIQRNREIVKRRESFPEKENIPRGDGLRMRPVLLHVPERDEKAPDA